MKINWKVRFRNKVWLWSFLSAIVGFVFSFLRLLNVTPLISENTLLNVIYQVLGVLGLMGILIDPTTKGIEDSTRAMGYEQPFDDDAQDSNG